LAKESRIRRKKERKRKREREKERKKERKKESERERKRERKRNTYRSFLIIHDIVFSKFCYQFLSHVRWCHEFRSGAPVIQFDEVATVVKFWFAENGIWNFHLLTEREQKREREERKEVRRKKKKEDGKEIHTRYCKHPSM
jgi:hypothetical protein